MKREIHNAFGKVFALTAAVVFIASADITCKGGEGVVETGKVFGVPQRVAETSPRIMATCLEGNRLYAGGGPDFYVLDVAEPLKPKLLGHVDGLAGVRQIAVRNGMAYVSAREAGLWIIDATDPAQPRVRSRFMKY